MKFKVIFVWVGGERLQLKSPAYILHTKNTQTPIQLI